MSFYQKESNIFYIYFQIIKKYKSYMEKSMEKYKLTPAEIHILTFLVNNKDRDITASEISTHRGVSKGLVSRAVSNLKDKHIIEVKENISDGRSVYLKIVDENNPLVVEMGSLNKKFKDQLIKDIAKEDLNKFFAINKKIFDNMKDIEI